MDAACGDVVVVGKKGCRKDRVCRQIFRHIITGGFRRRAYEDDPMGGIGLVVPVQLANSGQIPILALNEIVDVDLAVQIADPCVSALNQIICGGPCAVSVVDHDRVQTLSVKPVVQQDHWHVQGLKRRQIPRAHLCREKDQPRAAGRLNCAELFDDIFSPIEIGNGRLIAEPLRAADDALRHMFKKRRVRYDFSVPLVNNELYDLMLFGAGQVCILETKLIRGAQDLLPRRIADAGPSP
ncbi:hypothetical protein SDC9_99734 [bioreactor metagenome]|uniref:Uncharacterized protein n=1 Tax=bioreactor metagenome TaxID=1076179 RepID=A0A645AIF5_9ZZZZ